MERSLTAWEKAVLRRLCAVDAPALDVAREALDHLVVTGGCDCGCGSFDVRDVRQPFQPHELDHVVNGVGAGIGFALYLGRDRRPKTVDIFLPDERTIIEHGYPEPDQIEAWPGP